MVLVFTWVSGGSAITAQAPPLRHTFSGFPTDFLLDGSEVTLPFLLIAQTPGGTTLDRAVIDPCCQWSFEVLVQPGESSVVFVLSEPNDPSVVRGTSDPQPIEPGGRTSLQVLRFSSGSGSSFREITPVAGQAGQGALLDRPPIPTRADIEARITGMSVANPDELTLTFASGPIDPPRIAATIDSSEVEDLGIVRAGCGERTVELEQGFNLVGFTGSDASVADASSGYIDHSSPNLSGRLPTTFLFDSGSGAFSRNDATLPAALNGFSAFSAFDAVWVNVESPQGASWTIPISAADPRAVPLKVSWNLAVWTGPDGTMPPVAFRSILDLLDVAFDWDAGQQGSSSFRPRVIASLNTMKPLDYGTAVWLRMNAPGTWVIPAVDVECGGGSELPDFPAGAELVVQSAPQPAAELRVAAGSDFVTFRNTEVLQGTNTSRIGEPMAANDRNVILYTGNWHAAVSLDDGQTWAYIDPYDNEFPAPPRGGHSAATN